MFNEINFIYVSFPLSPEKEPNEWSPEPVSVSASVSAKVWSGFSPLSAGWENGACSRGGDIPGEWVSFGQSAGVAPVGWRAAGAMSPEPEGWTAPVVSLAPPKTDNKFRKAPTTKGLLEEGYFYLKGYTTLFQ